MNKIEIEIKSLYILDTFSTLGLSVYVFGPYINQLKNHSIKMIIYFG